MLTSLLILLSTFLPAQTSESQPLVISEIMQSNIDCIMDDLNEFPDSWVELYNTSDQAVSLSGYQLGISPVCSQAYALPATSIPAHGYIIIYCDKAATGLHTDYRLDSGKGGCVYLFHQGITVDSLINIPKQPAPNISFGRCYGNNQINYFRNATPAAQNEARVYKKDAILPAPSFSREGCVLTSTNSLTLTLSLPVNAPANTTLCYTLDGSEPTSDNGIIAVEPVSLTIDSTTIVRAKLLNDNYLSPRAVTQSYLFLGHSTNLPILSLTTDSRYWNDSQIGILVEGTYSQDTANYNYDWRRPINLEYFPAADDLAQLNQLCETRVHGGGTRAYQLKSLNLYANKRFGEKLFKHEFFPTQRPGITDFKSLVLRNGGNDFSSLYMRDAFAQQSMSLYQDMDGEAWQPAIVFINGQYKGVMNLRERSNEDLIYSNYNGLEDITMVENWGVKSGIFSQWEQFYAFLRTPGHTWEEQNQQFDCVEFINHTIMELFYANVDYPSSNLTFWRPSADGGRWRLLANDVDYIMDRYYNTPTDYNMFDFMYNPEYPNPLHTNHTYYTSFFTSAMENSTYREEFINRVVVYLGDFMRYDRLCALMDSMVTILQPELSLYHRPIYNIDGFWPEYDNEVERAQTWLSQRHAYFLQHMANRYGLSDAVELTVAPAGLGNATLVLNGITLSEPYWHGGFYGGRDIDLSASIPNASIEGWNVICFTATGSTTQYHEGAELHITMPAADCERVVIQVVTTNTVLDNPSVNFKSSRSINRIYNLQGVEIPFVTRGINIVVYSDGTTEKIIR